MEHGKALVIKLLIYGTLTFSIFSIFTHASVMKLMVITLVVTTVTFIGDVFILPRINQAFAIVANFAGLFLLYWLLGNLVVDGTVPIIVPALTAAYFGTMAEAIFHIYALERLHEPNIGPPLPVRYQTEFAEEDVKQTKEADKDKQ